MANITIKHRETLPTTTNTNKGHILTRSFVRFRIAYNNTLFKAKRKHEKRFYLLSWVVINPLLLSAFCVRTQ